MTNTAIRRTACAVVGSLFVAVGATLAATPAHADPSYDQQFIDYLDQHSVPYTSRTDAILLAKQFCLDATRQGSTIWLAGYNLAKKERWTQTETENFATAAIPAYCPRLGQ
jgi:Protein of unknown function (DUF732)